MEVNIAYACNDAYIMQTGISMISLFENNKDIEHIRIYFIDMGVTKDSRKDLQDIVDKYNREMIIIPFTEWEKKLPVDSTGRHIKSVYAKIFFGRIQDIDRILYIDSDTVVVDSLGELWNTDMDRYAIAGVQTINTPIAKERIGLNIDDLVINDGVALLNLKLWRELSYEKKCIDFIRKWNGNPPVLSEGTINSVCQNSLGKLDLRYNLTSVSIDFHQKEIEIITGTAYYSQKEIDNAILNPCIIHYVSGFHERPWCRNSTHPFKEQYFKYKKKSKWTDVELLEAKRSTRIRMTKFLHDILPIKVFCFFYNHFGKSNRK